MKTLIATSSMIICASLLSAQSPSNTMTVRVKKIENINGVEKVTDTTYSTNQLPNLEGDQNLDILKKEGKSCKELVIINDLPTKGVDTIITDNNDKIFMLFTNEMVENLVDEKGTITKQIITTVEDNGKNQRNENSKKIKVIIYKNVKLTDVDEIDAKMLGKQTLSVNNKLALEKLNFYPNPNNGKFNLSFTLNEKGNTEISILSAEGKTIYTDNLPDFTGFYSKEIDISKNPKGVYFVKIAQGKNAQLKKIVLE